MVAHSENMEKQKDITYVLGYMCECGKGFKSKSHLKRHMIIHGTKTDYKCEHCGKYFCQKFNLDRHMITHTGKGKFNCSICEKGFSYSNALDKHMAVHTGNWEFNCEQCGKGFSKKANFHRHVVTHTGETRYECNVCRKRVFHKSELVRHMTIHQVEKKYKCQFCGEAFAEKSDLMTHMNLHLRVTSLKCSICAQSFSTKTALYVHMAIHSGKKIKIRCKSCRKCVEVKLDSPAAASKRNFLCSSCKKGHTSGKRGKSNRKQSVARHSVAVVCNISKTGTYSSDGNGGDDDGNVEGNPLLQVQLNKGSLESSSGLVDAYSTSDDPSRTEDEILGLGSEYDGLGTIDPLSAKSDCISPSLCVFVNGKSTDSDEDKSGVQRILGHDIKEECHIDIQVEESGPVIKEECF